jgi:hypothetical protein
MIKIFHIKMNKTILLSVGIIALLVLVSCTLPTKVDVKEEIPQQSTSQPKLTQQSTKNVYSNEIKQTASGLKYIIHPDKLLSGGPPKDGIPSIDDPTFETIEQANSWVNDNELVLGIEYKGKARAYPLQVMVWHEIVNDKINTGPVLITYCPLCGTGIAFEGQIDVNGDGSKQPVEFGVSGKLYNSDLVMYDRATDSYWQQVTGQAIIGELSGQRLKLLPLDTITWKDWKEEHPDTDVLSKNTGHFRSYGASPYGDYDSNEQIYFPVDNVDSRFHPKAIIYGLIVGDKVKAYPEDLLKSAETVEDTFEGKSFTITRTKSGLVSAINTETDEEVGLVRSFWFAWYAFYPGTEVYGELS